MYEPEVGTRWTNKEPFMKRIQTVLISTLVIAVSMPMVSLGAFGLTSATDSYTVDTGAGLVFKVRRTDNGSNTQSPGDIMSLVWNGTEYQDQSRGSQINSGFDWLGYPSSAVAVSAQLVDADHIKITVVTDYLTHYYLARNGDPNIYMATYFTVQPVTGGGLCRYIVRMPSGAIPDIPPPGDIRFTTSTIESGDIFGMDDGTTRSKHYSNMRLNNWKYFGATGDQVGAWMVRDNHEGGSGGPFYRSLIQQCGGDQELTYIVNYGQAQTEAFRTHILNHYTLAFTHGEPPGEVDTSWFGSMGLTGYVAPAGRGSVSCSGISGRYDEYTYTVGFANATAQFWGEAASSNGSFNVMDILPGTYTMQIYKNELAVYTGTVSVSAGSNTPLNPITITADPSMTPPLWRIGDWDGTPLEFLNGDKVTTMHPSDVRMADWNTGTYTIGVSTPRDNWPAYHWKDPGPGSIRFELTADQLVDTIVRVGITIAYAGGRPNIAVNSWTSAFQSPSSQPSSRSLTTGTYRGNNVTYTFNVPASALVEGVNTLSVYPISGSGAATGFLSAGYSYDCIDWIGPEITAPAAPSGLTAEPRDGRVYLTWDPIPSASRYRVERASNLDGPYTLLSADVGPTSYTDAASLNGITHFYRVTAERGQENEGAVTVAVPSSIHTHLTFDEGAGTRAGDSVGNNDGTLASGASWTTGNIGSAVQLNGASTGYVELPRGVVEDADDCTISTWVRPTATPTWSRIFDFGSGTGAYMFLAFDNGSGAMRFAITSAGGSEESIEYNGLLSLGAWHHVALTLSGSVGTLYIDGTAVASNSSLTLKPSDLGDTAHNYIGKSQWPDPYATMKLDDFRIYTSALNEWEIASLVSMTSPPAPASLTAAADTNNVMLSWPSGSGAVRYNVKRSSTSGGPYTLLAGGISEADYAYISAQSDVYYYVVTAVNMAGESAAGPEAELLVVKIPEQPGMSVSPVAYYRFEEGVAGSDVIPGGDSVVDAAGGDDNMDASGADSAPSYSSTVPGSLVPASGSSNNLSVDFDGSDDLYTVLSGPLRTMVFTDFTVEAYVNFSDLANFQTIVGRDDSWNGTGGQDGKAQALFYLSKHADNHFRVEVSTAGGDLRAVESSVYATVGSWYHVAAVGDATSGTLTLYIDGENVGSTSGFDGLFDPVEDNAWTLGRGQYNGAAVDQLSGRIDEVRISAAALTPNQFLISSGSVVDDSDLDGLSDVWENYYFGNLNQSETSDPDLDGDDNRSEQLAGSPPTISSIPPDIELAIQSGNLSLGWSGNHIGWMLESTTNLLADSDWLPVPESTSTNEYEAAAGQPGMFYRLVYP